MTEDRMLRAFSELDMPAMPDPAFANRLYGALIAELGLEPAVKGAAGPVSVPAQPVRRWRTGSPARRRSVVVSLLAAALLLLAMLAGALLIAGSDPEPRTPLESVERSRAAFVQAPAVRFVIEDDMGATTVTGDGRGTWRSTSPDMLPESYLLYDGTRVGMYDATTRIWRVVLVQDGGPPYPFNTHFAWTDISYPDLVATLDPVTCTDATAAPPVTIAGRETEGIACPSAKVTYWVDAETGLVLRAEAAFGSKFWSGTPVDPASGDVQDESPTVMAISTFEVLDSVDPAAFDWRGPRMTDRTGQIPGTQLVIGEPPPPWTGTAIDGTPVRLPSPGAPMAVLLWSLGATSGQESAAAFDAAVTGAPGVAGIAVSWDPPGSLAGYRTMHPSSLPQVSDWTGSLSAAWGLASSMLVLITGDGRVAEVASASLEDTDLQRTIASLAAGSPAVVPAAVSSASPAPVSPQRTCDAGTHVVCAEPGDPMPAWVGQTADGREISSRSLLGQGALLWFDSPAMCDGPCPETTVALMRGLGDLAQAVEGAASVLLIASNEMDPGGTQALLDDAGATLDVVYDWDYAISRAIDQQTNGAILLDEDGRVVQQWVGAFDPADVQAAMRPLLASPAP